MGRPKLQVLIVLTLCVSGVISSSHASRRRRARKQTCSSSEVCSDHGRAAMTLSYGCESCSSVGGRRDFGEWCTSCCEERGVYRAFTRKVWTCSKPHSKTGRRGSTNTNWEGGRRRLSSSQFVKLREEILAQESRQCWTPYQNKD